MNRTHSGPIKQETPGPFLKVLRAVYHRIQRAVERAVAVIGRGVGHLLRLGITSSTSLPPVLLWPRFTSAEEAREQFWRVRYYLPECDATLLFPGPGTVDAAERPEHIGAMPEPQGKQQVVRGVFPFACAVWKALRRRGTLIRWRQEPPSGKAKLVRVFLRGLVTSKTLDRFSDPLEALEYLRLRSRLVDHHFDLEAHQARFLDYLAALPKYDRCYVFGTGPSLSLAEHLDFSDGYRLVCNTIVKDHDLLTRLQPHFIAAGDAVYHYGYTTYSRAFREDLACLLGTQSTRFVYPSDFDEIVARDFAGNRDKTIGIPIAPASGDIHNLDLRRTFALPRVGNVLNLMLLPLATTLANHVLFLGFDGRAPGDTFFWQYSDKHSYNDLFPSLQTAYPSFYAKTDYSEYQRRVMGEETEELLSKGERQETIFTPMTPSFSPAFERRYRRGWYAHGDKAHTSVLSEWEEQFFQAYGAIQESSPPQETPPSARKDCAP